jgi:DNA-binding beta-propeller fold protein YncE
MNHTPHQGDKVIPTEHTAKPAVTPKTGRFASLGAQHRAPGSGAPARDPIAAPFVARSLVVLCALAGLLALSTAAVAHAEPPKLVSYGSFASEGPGVAVDQASGDVFTAGFFDDEFKITSEGQEESVGKSWGHIEKLDAEGKPLSTFGKSVGENFLFFNEGWPFAGAAVNPVNGNLYVLEALSPETFAPGIAVYEPSTGKFISSFTVASPRNFIIFSILQIASDSSGNVYVPGENDILEYSEAGTLLKTFTGSGAGALKEPTGVAVDQKSGDLWVADAGNNRIVELDSSGAPVEVNGKPVEIESEGVFSVALDGHGDVFATVENSADPCGAIGSRCVHLIEYGSEGRQLADVGAGEFGLHGSTINHLFSMVAVNEASGRVYVTDSSRHTVWMFGPPTAPVVDRELTAEIGASEAKLGAVVNPGGLQATYRFEYGPTSAYGSSMPFPEGSVGEGVHTHVVWATASGLAAGTTYHYRVVATSELAPGGIAGPDQTFTTLTAEQVACPNEQMRGGLSARLPECRAYELVTPPVKTSVQFDAGEVAYASAAAADGEALTLRTREPLPGAPTGGYYYVATRGAGGWIAEDIMPLESYDGVICQDFQVVYAYSDQLTKDVVETGGASRGSYSYGRENAESCDTEGRQVVSGEPVGYVNLLARDNATGAYRLINAPPSGVTPADAHFQAASADASHVIFTETSPLAEGARYGVENLYEWDEGALRLVSVLPDGTAAPGSLAAKAPVVSPVSREEVAPEHEDVVSTDGSHVLFTYGGALYDRIDGQRTVQIDKKQGGSGPSGGGTFKAATSDGSKVFFLDESKLTAGSTAESNEPDLYECALPEGASKCELADLTVAAGSEHADVLRVTPLGRHDSSYVYFVAKGVLASNTREFTNSEGKTVVERAEAGKGNLYLWNGEKVTFIAAGIREGLHAVGRTSPDGKWLAFELEKSLTGYDNVKPNGESVGELFLYSAATGQLVCASCNPTGEPPVQGGGTVLLEGREDWSRRVLTDAGQVFFETQDALVPSDTNGQLDVYEYEGGRVYLISSGTSSFESNLEDVSESGDDVFFRSNQQLVPQDNEEGQIVIYDARVAGGFPAPASPPACTTADACRVPVAPLPSVYGAPASQTFSGLGNLSPPSPAVKTAVKKSAKCKKGFVKNKKGKCVRKKSKKQAKRASHNRRGK